MRPWDESEGERAARIAALQEARTREREARLAELEASGIELDPGRTGRHRPEEREIGRAYV